MTIFIFPLFQHVTVADVEKFVPTLLSSLHIEALIHGNVTEEDAINVVKRLEDG